MMILYLTLVTTNTGQSYKGEQIQNTGIQGNRQADIGEHAYNTHTHTHTHTHTQDIELCEQMGR